jgi:hypothetical protein
MSDQTRDDLARAVDAWAQTFADELKTWGEAAAALAALTIATGETK